MQTLSVSRIIRLTAVLLVAFLAFGMVTASPSHAADDVNTTEKLNADQLKRLAGLPPAERTAIRDQLTNELGKKACGDALFFGAMGGNECENISTKAFRTFLDTPEKVLDYEGGNKGQFCSALGSVGAPRTAVVWCAGGAAWQRFAPISGAVLRTALSTTPGGQAVLGAVDVVAFVANAKNGFEEFANVVKEGGVEATNEVLNNLMKVSSFQVDDSFRDIWAIFAGLGVILMALMYLKLFKDVSDEEIDLDTARQALFWYGPLSMVLVLFGPALGYVLNGWLVTVVESFSPWTSSRVADFIATISRFASYESNGVFGPLAAVLLFGLLFIGAWALLGLFALQPFALYLLGVGLALMLGFMVHPKYRRRVSKTGSLWLGIALAKPLMLLLMGALFSFISSRPAFGQGVDDAMVNATSVFMAAAAMLVLAFSPALLFKFVPVLPSSATSLGANRPSIAGAAMVAGSGAAIGAMIRNRRISHVQSGSGGGTRPVGAQGAGARIGDAAAAGVSGAGGGVAGAAAGGRRAAMAARQGQHASGQGGAGEGAAPESRTLGELQREERAGTPAGRTAQAVQSGAASVGRGSASVARGSAKVAAGGAVAFLLAGRESARQAALRGRQGASAMAPDTDHISGR